MIQVLPCAKYAGSSSPTETAADSAADTAADADAATDAADASYEPTAYTTAEYDEGAATRSAAGETCYM